MQKIEITCDACGQKFKVDDSYMGRTVECGACDHRFKITEQSKSKQQRKMYPGENKHDNKKKFVASTTQKEPAKVTFEQASYAQKTDPAVIMPLSPLRILCIFLGVGMISCFILIFIIARDGGGLLQDIPKDKRIVLSAFISILGSGLILFGCRKHRAKGALVAALLSGGLVALAVTTEVHATPESGNHSLVEDSSDNTSKARNIDKYKKDIGYSKVEDYIQQKKNNNENPEDIKALVVVGFRVQHKEVIINHIHKHLKLREKPQVYSSGRSIILGENDDEKEVPISLLILDCPDFTMEQIEEFSKEFSSPQPITEDLKAAKLLEIHISQHVFDTPDRSQLHNEDAENFFDINYRELYSIDKSRRLSAIKRLQLTKNKGRRADIAAKLVKMLDASDPDFSVEVVKTLNAWTLKEYKTDDAVKTVAAELSKKGVLHTAFIDYLTDQSVPEISSILAEQWAMKSGIQWSEHIMKNGAEGEQAIIKALPEVADSHYKEAATILQQIGTAKSLPALKKALSKAEGDDKKYLKAVIDEIKSRQ